MAAWCPICPPGSCGSSASATSTAGRRTGRGGAAQRVRVRNRATRANQQPTRHPARRLRPVPGRARRADAARRSGRSARSRHCNLGEGAASMRGQGPGTLQLGRRRPRQAHSSHTGGSHATLTQRSYRRRRQLHPKLGATLISKCVRAAVLTVAATALVGGAAACSSNNGSGTTSSAASSSASSTTTSESAAAPSKPDHEAFAKCLTDNGVPAPPEGGPGGPGGPPDGTPPSGPPPEGGPPQGGPPPMGHQHPPAPPGVDQATWDKAMQACASLAPAPPNG